MKRLGHHRIVPAGAPVPTVEVEARMVAEMAAEAHRKGMRFAGWPEFTRTWLRPADVEDSLFGWRMVPCPRASAEHLELRAEVLAEVRS